MKRIDTPPSVPGMDGTRSPPSVPPPPFRAGVTTRARARNAPRTSPPPRPALMPGSRLRPSFTATTRPGPQPRRESGSPYPLDGNARPARMPDEVAFSRDNTDSGNGPAYQWVRMAARLDIPDPDTARRLWNPQQVLDELARRYDVCAYYRKGNYTDSVGVQDAPFVGTVEMFGGHWSIRPGDGVEYRIDAQARAVDHAFTVLRLHAQGQEALDIYYRAESVDEKGVIELAPRVSPRPR